MPKKPQEQKAIGADKSLTPNPFSFTPKTSALMKVRGREVILEIKSHLKKNTYTRQKQLWHILRRGLINGVWQIEFAAIVINVTIERVKLTQITLIGDA